MGKNRRRDLRKSPDEGFSFKKTLYISIAIIALGVIAFFATVMIYNHNLEKIYTDLETTSLGDTSSETLKEIEEASSSLTRTVDELEGEETEEISAENEEAEETNTEPEEETVTQSSVVATAVQTEEIEEEQIVEEEEEEKDPDFIKPVDGEIIKKYAKDSLVYSDTLKEWVTHTGIDIQAAKATVVKAAADGTVTAIKNDPRYGITVIIEHSNGYETRYANLLTAEFVTEGEEVVQGQTIGTVGNTAAFEIVDDYHLHFEILKDDEYVDPELYIN